jgi:predicted dehydrogenase
MINIAVVGYGYWGPNLVRNIQELGDARVISCCDMNPERLTQVKTKFPSLEITTKYEDILNNPSVDAVVIATPVSTHFDLASRAFEHGKHVLLEKPATASVAEAEKLVEMADKRNLTYMVDHTFIYTGAVSKMKEIIDRGDLGHLYYIDSVRINLGLIQRDVNVLWDLAPHDIAIMDHLIKEKPISVCATGACHVGTGLENVAYLTVYFESGFIAHFHNNWLSPLKIRTMLVGGSKKTIHYDDMEVSEKIKVYDRGVDVSTTEGIRDVLVSYRLGDMWAPRLNVTEALRVMVGEFVGCIQTGRRPITDGASGLNVVKILEASEKSIKQRGKEIKL